MHTPRTSDTSGLSVPKRWPIGRSRRTNRTALARRVHGTPRSSAHRRIVRAHPGGLGPEPGRGRASLRREPPGRRQVVATRRAARARGRDGGSVRRHRPAGTSSQTRSHPGRGATADPGPRRRVPRSAVGARRDPGGARGLPRHVPVRPGARLTLDLLRETVPDGPVWWRIADRVGPTRSTRVSRRRPARHLPVGRGRRVGSARALPAHRHAGQGCRPARCACRFGVVRGGCRPGTGMVPGVASQHRPAGPGDGVRGVVSGVIGLVPVGDVGARFFRGVGLVCGRCSCVHVPWNFTGNRPRHQLLASPRPGIRVVRNSTTASNAA